jgi:cellulose synthase/poly-beta-1,6-N-acetylglucosamine synthase-like glycosyltransferase
MNALMQSITRREQAHRICVVVPTYRRPEHLARCLESLARQIREPDQVLVIVRADDAASWALLRRPCPFALPLTIVTVTLGGVVAALNAALDSVEADLVAFTDDDAAPRAEWLQGIERHFAADPLLGGLGGRDWVYQHGRLEAGQRNVVGRVTWYGRCIGNHHLGVGPPREVELLKGVNMSFRRAALAGIRFDSRLRGSGAQVGNEMGICMAVRRRGWKLVYDPDLAVDHFPAVRHDEDRRNAFSVEAIRNAVFNETLLLYEHFGALRRFAFMTWAMLVGTRAAPGLLHWMIQLAERRPTATSRFKAALGGRLHGWRAATP